MFLSVANPGKRGLAGGFGAGQSKKELPRS